MVCNRVGRAVLTGAFVFAVLAGARSDGLAQTPPRRDTFSAKTVNMSVNRPDLKMDVIAGPTRNETRSIRAGDKSDRFS